MSKKEAKPKRGLSAYMFFCSEKRPEIIKKYPDMKFGEIGKKLGEMWKNLSDAQKEPFKKKAMKDKQRYEKEKSKQKDSKLVKPKKTSKSKKSSDSD